MYLRTKFLDLDSWKFVLDQREHPCSGIKISLGMTYPLEELNTNNKKPLLISTK
jgi:hypothetical protein